MDAHANAVLDREQLRNITLDDAALMRDIVAALIDDTSQQLIAIEGAIHAGDPRACTRLAHYSKGACANVGARSAAELLKSIEFSAHQSDFARCRASLEALATELDRLRVEARSL